MSHQRACTELPAAVHCDFVIVEGSGSTEAYLKHLPLPLLRTRTAPNAAAATNAQYRVGCVGCVILHTQPASMCRFMRVHGSGAARLHSTALGRFTAAGRCRRLHRPALCATDSPASVQQHTRNTPLVTTPGRVKPIMQLLAGGYANCMRRWRAAPCAPVETRWPHCAACTPSIPSTPCHHAMCASRWACSSRWA